MSFTRKNIITLPHKHLRQRSGKIGATTDDIRQTVEDMKSATLDWEDHRQHEVGVALAAIQIDKKLKLVIIRSNFDDKDDRTFKVLINPRVTKRYGGIVEDFEGCLSVKDIYGKVPRYGKIKVKAIGLDGQEIRLNAEGFLARVLQHEIDHTKGILFIDHIKNKRDSFYRLSDEGKLNELDWEEAIKGNKDLWG